jgi:hypothetical protein
VLEEERRRHVDERTGIENGRLADAPRAKGLKQCQVIEAVRDHVRLVDAVLKTGASGSSLPWRQPRRS